MQQGLAQRLGLAVGVVEKYDYERFVRTLAIFSESVHFSFLVVIPTVASDLGDDAVDVLWEIIDGTFGKVFAEVFKHVPNFAHDALRPAGFRAR